MAQNFDFGNLAMKLFGKFRTLALANHSTPLESGSPPVNALDEGELGAKRNPRQE
jgi:hypothetical protein